MQSFGAQLQDVFTATAPAALHQPAALCKFLCLLLFLFIAFLKYSTIDSL